MLKKQSIYVHNVVTRNIVDPANILYTTIFENSTRKNLSLPMLFNWHHVCQYNYCAILKCDFKRKPNQTKQNKTKQITKRIHYSWLGLQWFKEECTPKHPPGGSTRSRHVLESKPKFHRSDHTLHLAWCSWWGSSTAGSGCPW